jgi:lysophospholipase L1-like esterase
MGRLDVVPFAPHPLRVACIAAYVACIGACGEAVTKPKPSPLDGLQTHGKTQAGTRPIAETPAEIATPSHATVAGALERPAALRRFFESLARLEAGQAQDDVRVTQFGDSHTAADIETAAVRRALQARFGDGGRGFVAIGRPWKRYLQDGVRVGMSTEWAPDKGKLERGGRISGDGMYGLSGIGLFTHQHGARAWTDVTSKTSHAELAYLEQPGGGAFDVFVDGVRVVRIATRGETTSSAFRAFDVSEASAHQLEVRAVGDGDVRVFGLSLDRAQHGIVLDALGIIGARISTALSWNESHWAEQLKHRAPALVVLAYGTNESTDVDMPQHTYERQIVDALGRVARAVPAASCLLLGPPDRAIDTKDGWTSAPKIAEIIAAQRRVAEAAGCAFYDQSSAMGGEGSMARWAAEDPPRAQKDRVHLTRDGYAQLGSSFASDLMRGYAAWRREAGLSPSTSREPPVSASSLPAVSEPDSAEP